MTSSAGGVSPGGTNTCGFSVAMKRTLTTAPCSPLYDDRPGLLEWAAHGAVSVLWGEGTVVMKRSLLVLLSAFVLGVTAVGSVPAVASTDDPQVAVSQVQPADRDDDESKDDGKDNKDSKDNK